MDKVPTDDSDTDLSLTAEAATVVEDKRGAKTFDSEAKNSCIAGDVAVPTEKLMVRLRLLLLLVLA